MICDACLNGDHADCDLRLDLDNCTCYCLKKWYVERRRGQ